MLLEMKRLILLLQLQLRNFWKKNEAVHFFPKDNLVQ
jgi:hypothetical protein